MQQRGELPGRQWLEAWNWRADRVGEQTLVLARGVRRFLDFVFLVLATGVRLRWIHRPAVVAVMIRQIYFTGVQSLLWVLLLSLGAGVLTVYNIVTFAKGIGDLSLIGRLVNGVLVQEMAPLIIAVFLLARSGVAVVTEVGTMHIRGEDLLLRSLGISRKEYLYWPRMMAFALCGLILTFMFVAIALWVGGLVVSWTYTLNFNEYLIDVRQGTTLAELLMMAGKGLLYPLLSCGMLLDQAGRVGDNPNQIPVRATYGVLGSLMIVLFLDGLTVLASSLG
ncbi:MAG TPA: ABC transporter permease [Mariprofundaceae bacterium]|nr:ABC transporter permease [Mariprofundaceae bacterium]